MLPIFYRKQSLFFVPKRFDMCRSGFRLENINPEIDTGKCFSLNRKQGYSKYGIIIGDIIIHPNLIYNMDKAGLQSFILRKINKGRCFAFEYEAQFKDELRICISVERELDFYFYYGYEGWTILLQSTLKRNNGVPDFVSEFSPDEIAEFKVS